MEKNNNRQEIRQVTENVIRREELDKRLLAAATHHEDQVLAMLDTSSDGLDKKTVERHREQYGDNKVSYGRQATLAERLVKAFVNPFTAILVVLAVVSTITDIAIPLAQNEMDDFDPLTAIIILTMVLISGVLRFVQETRSGNAASRLLAMIRTTTSVKRAGEKEKEILLEEVVVGDIIHLAAGDMIPADLRIIQSKDLFVSQAALTGESDQLEKMNVVEKEGHDTLTEYPGLAFMGSNVISGSAIGVAIATGDDTLFGTMAQSITQEPVVTSFEKGVNAVSWVLIHFMMVMVPLVFFINGITKGDWMEAFLFGISVAVGLTPEMLPMIVTTCLAKGAVAMSKEKTIIKNLNSIQNFGAIDVLCTDKTGTLTQDKVVLEYHLDVHGNEDARVLRHAFLNSYYQTGLKNLMDIAIIERTKEEQAQDDQLTGLSTRYMKVDEVPFDFSRRRMSVVVKDANDKIQMITKGAVEEMLNICSHVEYQGNVEVLDEGLKKKILKTVDDLNEDGMRVIAIAQKTNPSPVGMFSVEDECDMVLLGYLAFLDPPKESTAEAIEALLEHGVTTKVLTGDNDKVTRTICRQVGLRVDNLLLGSDIEKMTDTELGRAVVQTNVFAKLSPEQKARIVRVLRETGHTVGFMGMVSMMLPR